MPLRIKLPPHDRIIINGAVIENSGDSTTIIIHNRVDILRRKEVMAEHEATTPARRVYYALQCAYMFDDERSRYITHALDFLKQYRDAAPSAALIIAKIAEEIEEQRYYGALKATNELMAHESERLEVALNDPSQATLHKSMNDPPPTLGQREGARKEGIGQNSKAPPTVVEVKKRRPPLPKT